MANQGNHQSGYPNSGHQAHLHNPFYAGPRRLALNAPPPLTWQHAIHLVTMDDLVNIDFNLAPQLDADIMSILAIHNQSDIMNWYHAVYRGIWGTNATARRQHLRDSQIDLPNSVMITLNSITDHEARESMYQRRRAQHFLVLLLRVLGAHNMDVADALINRLRIRNMQPILPVQPFVLMPSSAPPQPAMLITTPTTAPIAFPNLQSVPAPTQVRLPTSVHAPVSLPMVSPSLPQPQPSPAPSTASSEEEEKRLYCPLCDNSRKIEDYRGVKAHWRAKHYRSSRASAWLKEIYENGEIGPWTAKEVKQRKLEGRRYLKANEEGARRDMDTKEAKKWNQRMKTDPDQWEKKAQEEDGYTDYDQSFVSHLMKNRADGRKRAAAQTYQKNKRQKKDDDDVDESKEEKK